MKKVIEANVDKQDAKNEKDAQKIRNAKALTGLAAVSLLSHSADKRARQKLMNDIMYYLRKLINLAKQVQNLSEGVENQILSEDELTEFEEIKSKIDELEDSLKDKEK